VLSRTGACVVIAGCASWPALYYALQDEALPCDEELLLLAQCAALGVAVTWCVLALWPAAGRGAAWVYLHHGSVLTEAEAVASYRRGVHTWGEVKTASLPTLYMRC